MESNESKAVTSHSESHTHHVHCSKCNRGFGIFTHNYPCAVCQKALCSRCYMWLLLPKEKRDPSNNVQSVCEDCFEKHNTLDMSKKMDVYGPEDGLPIVLVHGGLGNRRQWKLQIPELSKKYRLYVPDLPAHGSRYKEKLTLKSAMDVIAEVIEKEIPSKKAVIIGYSLGGYISMAFAGTYPQLTVGVIAGGTGADLSQPLNHFALNVMSAMVSLLSPPTIVKASNGQATKEEVPAEEVEDLLSTGSISNLGATHDINHNILLWRGYVDALSKFDGPILFINGEKDTRNGEQKWLSACKKGELKVIPGAGHLMTHSSKYRDVYLSEMIDWLNSNYKQ